jgi:hypothetical protein
MSKAYKCQVVSNRMRNIQRGTYTELDRKEADIERRKKLHIITSMRKININW